MTKTPATPEYRLLSEFRRLFEGKIYKHRDSSQGDFVAMHLYEDLIAVNRSPKLTEAAINRKDRVLNVQNKRRGVSARRGDGTFGELIPGESPITDDGYLVSRGTIATVEIGIEMKVLAKAMIKQIDRVINDLRNQVVQFKRGGGNPICVAVIGINHAESTIGYEGDRPFPTTGRHGFLHPYQEAPEAEHRLKAEAAPEFDEFLVLRFKATNAPPYPFEWATTKTRGWITRLRYRASALATSSDSSSASFFTSPPPPKTFPDPSVIESPPPASLPALAGCAPFSPPAPP
ncbi:MAG TPA: hypothetical protein VK335_31715 [Bryobacteraceae bacterium]|nr:hypothetical protein [Bryobacteraceae bacterium]